MTRYLLYAPGTRGIGHFRRIQAILKKLLCSIDQCLLLTSSDYGYIVKEKMLKVQVTKVQNKNEFLSAALKFNPEVLIVDTFPFGVDSALWPFIANKQIKKILILRQRHDISLKLLKKQIAFYDLVLLPYKKGNLLSKQLNNAPNICSVGEIFNTSFIKPEITRKKFHIPKKATFILATCGGGGTMDSRKITPVIFEVLKKLSNELKVHVVFSTGPMNKMKVQYSDQFFKSYEYIENIQNLISAATLVVCFGGYNTINEVIAAGVPAIVLPSRTRTDDQIQRASEVKSYITSELITTRGLTTEKLYKTIKKFLLNKRLLQKRIAPHQSGAQLAAEKIRKLVELN